MNKVSLFLLSLAVLGLAPAPVAAAPIQDRCATLGPDGYPASCEPTVREYAWWWNDDVCCDAAGCTSPSSVSNTCPASTTRQHCDYARFDSGGEATCQYLVPKYCDHNDCPSESSSSEDLPSFTFDPQGSAICCYPGAGCYAPNGDFCGGYLWWCLDGVCEEDGTITCFDADTPA